MSATVDASRNNSHGISSPPGYGCGDRRRRSKCTVDCVDADVMCGFSSVALGYVEEPPPAGYLSSEASCAPTTSRIPPPGSIGAIVDPDGTGPRVLFLRVPEQKRVKNRLHFDLAVARPTRRGKRRSSSSQSAGATAVRRVEENGQWWMVMGDPEGNEFCVT